MAKLQNFVAEKNLLSVLERVSRAPEGYSALQLSVSKLRPENRHPAFVKIFARLFESAIGSTRGYFFILSNDDFVVLSKFITPERINEALDKLKAGLARDPMVHGRDMREFAAIYAFPERFTEFYRHIEDMVDHAERYAHEESALRRPMESSEVEEVMELLGFIDLSDLVKRQSVIKFNSATDFQVAFQEFFVAVKDLQLQVGDRVEIDANRWLFAYMTQWLDKRVLGALASRAAEIRWTEKISLNLNLSTIASPEFDAFLGEVPALAGNFVAEARLMDIFNNTGLYFEALEKLHGAGGKMLVDGASPSILKILDIGQLKVDFVKLFWEPLLEFNPFDTGLKETIARLGAEKAILAKCDSEAAIKWGFAHGITVFQGPFIDKMEAAIVREKCPAAARCSEAECLRAKRHLIGALPAGCLHGESSGKLLKMGSA